MARSLGRRDVGFIQSTVSRFGLALAASWT